MKKITMFLVLACIMCAVAFAQQSYYVSANGSNDNDGLSETRPMRTLAETFLKAREGSIKKITIIGTLDEESDFMSFLFIKRFCSVFFLSSNPTYEITITGKPGVTGSERAVLSARRSGAGVVYIDSGKVRFEHIEISGGEGEDGSGIYINGGATVTLGQGTVVRGNAFGAVCIEDGTCVIDGGEVRDNQHNGVMVYGGSLTMRSGSIKDNIAPDSTGGVIIYDGGRFTMSGGTINGNRGYIGGGVFVMSGGRFDQTGGTINGNIASRGSNPNIFREQGALGSNLR